MNGIAPDLQCVRMQLSLENPVEKCPIIENENSKPTNQFILPLIGALSVFG